MGHAQSANPLPQVYVKVYSRMQGSEVRFYNDGYTDLRGPLRLCFPKHRRLIAKGVSGLNTNLCTIDPGDTESQDAFDRHRKESKLGFCAVRVAVASTVFFFCALVILYLTQLPMVPARGELSYSFSVVFLFLGPLSMVLLLFFVAVVVSVCIRFVNLLAKESHLWTEAAIRHLNVPQNYPPRLVDEIMKMDMISKRTEAVERLLKYPILVIIVFVVSQILITEFYRMSLWQAMLILLYLAIPAGAYAMLQHTARRVRRKAVERVYQEVRDGKAGNAQQWQRAIARIHAYRGGAFLPWWKRPGLPGLGITAGGLVIIEQVLRLV